MKMKKNLFLAFSLCLSFNVLLAQQTPVFSDYVYNQVLLNPAHAGFYKSTDLTLTYRNTASDFVGAPEVLSGVVNAPTKSENIGIGASVLSDRLGVANITSITGSIAYKIIFDFHDNRVKWWEYNPNTLTFGLSAGGIVYNEDLLSLGIQDDPEFAQNINEVVPKLGIGALYNRQQFYVGVSNTNLIASLYEDKNVSVGSPTYFYGGLRIYTDIFHTYILKPSFLAKYEKGFAPQFDANFTASYKNIIEGGLGYRTNNSANAMVAFNSQKKWRFMFSYNFALQEQVLDRSFGILISYRFGGDI